MQRKTQFRLSTVTAALLGLAISQFSQADVTGNIGVYSKYVLRGITTTYTADETASGDAPEEDTPALQGGLDYTNGGWYAGYWFSTLGYSADPTKSTTSTENDLYGGYNFAVGSTTLTLGATYYIYQPGEDFDALELKLGLSAGAFSLTAQRLLKDVIWGNEGDTYYLGTYATKLPMDFSFSAALGYYTYVQDGQFIDGEAIEASPDCNGCKALRSGFRHITLGVTHPLGSTGGTWGLQYIIGGKNRFDIQQKDQLVGNVSFGF